MKKTETKKIGRKDTKFGNQQVPKNISDNKEEQKNFNQFGLSDNVSVALNGNPRKMLSFKVRF